MPRALLFGYEGVLVDHRDDRREIAERVLAEEGLSLPAGRRSGPWDEEWMAAALAAAAGGDRPGLAPRLAARAAAYLNERLRRRGESWAPGAAEVVRRAASKGLTLGLVSAAAADELRAALRRAVLESCFKVIVSGDDVECSGPSPAAHLEAIQRLNSEPPLPERLFHAHEIVAIEGSPEGLQAAAAAGLVTVGIGPATSAPADLHVTHLDLLDLGQLAALASGPR